MFRLIETQYHIALMDQVVKKNFTHYKTDTSYEFNHIYLYNIVLYTKWYWSGQGSMAHASKYIYIYTARERCVNLHDNNLVSQNNSNFIVQRKNQNGSIAEVVGLVNGMFTTILYNFVIIGNRYYLYYKYVRWT